MKKVFYLIMSAVIAITLVGCSSDSSAPQKVETPKADTPAQKEEPQQVPTPPAEPAVKTYKDGMHKVGTDIPAGEYVLMSNSFMSYFEVANDSKGTLDSIIANDNFYTRSIVTVKDGQYLKLQGCKAYAFAGAPKVEIKDGFLPEGMYKVGVDIPAGEYKVIPEGMGYVEVSSNSTHDLMSIVSNDNLTGESYITVQDGQYLKLSGAKLKLN
ncbi:hypothetical protein [Desulfitobacterium sp. PCE1]|uniref:hypothetical protein n=1 Tax=Desulfitobacterium sp. PCE1 TaxID=146907 RepID=UPI00035CB361|nr:hypothetical protein [Desulfitobacterium sp. PCE1]